MIHIDCINNVVVVDCPFSEKDSLHILKKLAGVNGWQEEKSRVKGRYAIAHTWDSGLIVRLCQSFPTMYRAYFTPALLDRNRQQTEMPKSLIPPDAELKTPTSVEECDKLLCQECSMYQLPYEEFEKKCFHRHRIEEEIQEEDKRCEELAWQEQKEEMQKARKEEK